MHIRAAQLDDRRSRRVGEDLEDRGQVRGVDADAVLFYMEVGNPRNRSRRAGAPAARCPR
ncbi:MAG: hypothetical protein WDN06_16795 [Asticcacaulis sp.]